MQLRRTLEDRRYKCQRFKQTRQTNTKTKKENKQTNIRAANVKDLHKQTHCSCQVMDTNEIKKELSKTNLHKLEKTNNCQRPIQIQVDGTSTRSLPS